MCPAPRLAHCALLRAALTFRIKRLYEVRDGEPLSVTARMMWATPDEHGLFAGAQFGRHAAVSAKISGSNFVFSRPPQMGTSERNALALWQPLLHGFSEARSSQARSAVFWRLPRSHQRLSGMRIHWLLTVC